MSVVPPSPAELAARAAITDVLHRYCRAMDRMDKPLALSCWHPGGTDEHTPLYAGSAEGFVEWVWAVHRPMILTRHTLSNILIEVEGDQAWSESYWTVLLRVARDGGIVDVWSGGRYVDHHRCLGGRWAMQHRRSVHDWDRVMPLDRTMENFPGAPLVDISAPDAPIFAATRDVDDPSYRALGGHDMAYTPR